MVAQIDNGVFEMDMRSMRGFNLTPGRIREIVRRKHIHSGPGLDRKYMPTQDEMDTILNMAEHAIEMGQLIDFGYWPNSMIKQMAKRAGKNYVDGALMHPFSSPYIILHSWDDQANLVITNLARKFGETDRQTCAYLVNPFQVKPDDMAPDFEAMTFEGLAIDGMETLGIGDRLDFYTSLSKQAGVPVGTVIPFLLRFIKPGTPDWEESTESMGVILCKVPLPTYAIR